MKAVRPSRSEKTYDHCVPPEYADLSLLPEVRTVALDLFNELAIPREPRRLLLGPVPMPACQPSCGHRLLVEQPAPHASLPSSGTNAQMGRSGSSAWMSAGSRS